MNFDVPLFLALLRAASLGTRNLAVSASDRQHQKQQLESEMTQLLEDRRQIPDLLNEVF